MKASEKQLMKGADGLWESNESTCTDSEHDSSEVTPLVLFLFGLSNYVLKMGKLADDGFDYST